MNKKGQWYVGIQIMFGVLIFMSLLILLGSMFYFFSINNKINEQSTRIANSLDKTEQLLSGLETDLSILDSIPQDIKGISNNLNNITQSSKIITDKIAEIDDLKKQINDSNQDINKLLIDYKPITNNYFNASQEEINQAFNKTINIKIFKLVLSFFFGSLFGSIITISLYFIFKKEKK